MSRRLALLLSAALLLPAPSLAREQSDAPDAAIIGFSPDGRFFAWEQYGYDLAGGALSAVVFVVDRQTNGQAEGFPFGLLPDGNGDGEPDAAGGYESDPDALTDDPDIDALRADVRDKAAGKLAALSIGTPGRRLAGVPLTQRSPLDKKATPLVFVLQPTLPSAIPDLQRRFTIEARPSEEPEDCFNIDPPIRGKTIAFDVIATVTWPDVKDVGRSVTDYRWAMPAGSCASGLWIADIVAPPGEGDDAVAVLFMESRWNSAVDEAQWHGLFVRLPAE
jgi:hypothetical protein